MAIECNMTLNTMEPCSSLYNSKEEADVFWTNVYSKINLPPIVLISDVCLASRPFLQHMEDHQSKIIIYITNNNIDYGLFGIKDIEYLQIFSNMLIKYPNRICILADNNYQIMNTNLKCNLLLDIVATPTYKVNQDKEYNIIKKSWFIFQKGTNPLCYINNIKNHFVMYNKRTIVKNNNKVFQHVEYLQHSHYKYDEKDSYKDMNELTEYIGCIHLPYKINTQTIYEAWSNGIIFCIPTLEFHILNNFYWEDTSEYKLQSFIQSVWYNTENEGMFEFFNSWEECNALFIKLQQPNYYISKRNYIKNKALEKYNQSILIWKNILQDEIKPATIYVDLDKTFIHIEKDNYPTIVSMFYDVKSKKNRSNETYFNLAKEFILQTPCPLIIYYEDEKVKNFCIQNRKKNKPLTCIYLPFNSTGYAICIPRLYELQNTFQIINGILEHETPEYIVLNCNKFFFMEHAINNNIYNSSHFMWMDFGINHVAKINNKWKFNFNYIQNTTQITQMCINPLISYEIEEKGGLKPFFQYIYHHISGGLFAGPKDTMITYINEFKETFIEILNNDWYQIDEAIMTIVSFKHRDLFLFYYGDYQAIVSNHPYFIYDEIECKEHITAIICKYAYYNQFDDIKKIICCVSKTFPYLKTQWNEYLEN